MELDNDIKEAKKILKEEGAVIFPTETAYGIAVDATNPEAIRRVYEAKGRSLEKGLTTIVSSLKQAEEYAELSNKERKLVEEFMPGPLTLVVEKKDSIPNILNEKFVFRIPGNKIAQKLASDFPITATSANISGEETSYSVDQIAEELLDKVDYVLDTGKLGVSPTSTIVEIQNGEIIMHREGPIKKKEIEKVLQG